MSVHLSGGPASTRALRLGAAVVAAAGVAAAAACGTGSREDGKPALQARTGVAGCWQLTVTAEGARRDSLRAWLPAGSLPRVLELDTAAAEAAGRADSVYRAYSWFDGRRETSPFSVWQRFAGDSIRVQRAGALAGLMLRLAPADEHLAGTLVLYRDALAPGEPGRRTAPVRARPRPCPGEDPT